MKYNILKISILGVLALGATTSCERELDQASYTQVSLAEAMKSESNFTQAINGAYTAFKGSGYFSVDTGNQIAVPDITTDNLILNPQGRNTNFSAYNWSYSASDGSTTGLFSQAYFVISRANMPLKYIDNLPAGSFRNNIEGQARAIRAAAHFDLVRAYAKIPTQSADANSSMGIAYVDIFDPSNLTFTRNLTVAQVYDRVIDDLLFAAANITDAPSDRSKFSKTAIYGLLSRVYLYKGDMPNTILYGNLAIAASPSVGSIGNFPTVWSSNNVDGVLLKILNSTQEGVTVGVAYQQGATAVGGNIRSEYVVPKSFYDLFTTNDVRKNSYMRQSAYQGSLRNHVIKYATNTGGGTGLNIVEPKYLRMAEVYLNVAEAAYLTNPALSNSLLNTLKAQRYTGYTPVTLAGTALFDEIMKQRRLELAFENDRFYTFKRLGLTMQRTGEGQFVDGTGTASPVQQILPSNTKWQWPIPLGAININPNIAQNPGY